MVPAAEARGYGPPPLSTRKTIPGPARAGKIAGERSAPAKPEPAACRRDRAGIGITASLRRITSSGPPSRRRTKGNVGKRHEAVAGGHAAGGRATGGCCDANPNQKPRSHDTSRIAWAKLMARVGEEFPLECPGCGGDIHRRVDRRQEPTHFEPEVRKRKKARMASPA